MVFWIGATCERDWLDRCSVDEDRYAYNQVAGEDLQDLSLCTGSASKGFLQDVDKEMAERGADKGTVDGHLGHTRGEVVAILVAVLCDPGSEDFLGTRQRARGDHLGTKRVGLELAQV
jgi:hypothetical protein